MLFCVLLFCFAFLDGLFSREDGKREKRDISPKLLEGFAIVPPLIKEIFSEQKKNLSQFYLQ